ncbi:LuxR family transcriptional regulator [Pseudonocardia yunnanensis]|uniref:AAA family ATPase n=1 Tax=Pseudonocardia yunnanensis TaxID=58107 RepID=A0ABW4FDN0_9PSEU
MSGWRVLPGRDRESELLAQPLEAVLGGESRALVVHGEPGVGKTALLDHALAHTPGARIARAAGIQSEMELAYSGLHQLCVPLLEHADRLPTHHHDALTTALGLHDGPTPDRFLVGLAVLGLLAEAARGQPLICLIDDAQWLDRASAQTLAFTARRLGAESVAMLFVTRRTSDIPELDGLPDLLLTGLSDHDARALLATALPWPVDERVRDRIIAEARGNPLALLQLHRGLTPAELTGGFGPAPATALPTRIETSFQRQLTPLPSPTRQLLLLAAAEPLGDPTLLWKAAHYLGISPEAAAPAAAVELLTIDNQVRFHHPLERSAIYTAASPDERRHAHHALAYATDPHADPDRHAWHAAQATTHPDTTIADALEHSAARAQARGGLAAAAAFLERAAHLTPDAGHRTQRALAAAHAKHRAGIPTAAQALISLAEAGPLTTHQQADINLLRAQIAFTTRRGNDAPRLLLEAAQKFETINPRKARETYLEALSAAMFAGLLADSGCIREIAEAARTAPPAAEPACAADLLLDALAVLFTDGYAAAVPLLRRVLGAFRSEDIPTEEALRWFWLASRVPSLLWDFDTLDVINARFVTLARDAGALAELPIALCARILVLTARGDLEAAEQMVGELETVTEATTSPVVPYGALLLAAWRGNESKVDTLIHTTTTGSFRRGEGIGLFFVGWAQALLYNSLGRYTDALAAAEQAAKQQEMTGLPTWLVQVELIEATARSGMPGRAAFALKQLTDVTRASSTEWGLGIAARSRALLTDGPAAERIYRTAIHRLCRAGLRGELARAHLVYGEWLRRRRQRVAARQQLRTAYDMFTDLGMEAFAGRAGRELRATGATTRKRANGTPNLLTPQEGQIARLAREGLSNAEIGARLFISPRTVEWHLRRIFKKLHISSRKQLDG